MSNHYKVTYTPQALQDLTELYEYICFILRAPKAAENQSSRIKGLFVHLIQCPCDIHLFYGSLGILWGFVKYLLITTWLFTALIKRKVL